MARETFANVLPLNIPVKKTPHKDTRDSSPVLLACFSQGSMEVHEAHNISVDSPVELAVCGLCQSGIKNISLSAKDAVAAVKRSILSLPSLLTPLSATQQAY